LSTRSEAHHRRRTTQASGEGLVREGWRHLSDATSPSDTEAGCASAVATVFGSRTAMLWPTDDGSRTADAPGVD
jgi:hypothetical protein